MPSQYRLAIGIGVFIKICVEELSDFGLQKKAFRLEDL
ncbi:hypothetical protein FHS68_001272 [Dyadobacter arcticus]|uniref:Uncharacterized protein n=1 Tax=Dyadobacter arcticus TaxID=1078754 RepID=A0ABX0UM05_9BACT|nr:hypothetical protein [Dyadobacter arcticus]